MRKQLNLLPAEKWCIPCFSQSYFLALFFRLIFVASHIDCKCMLFIILTNEIRWSIFAFIRHLCFCVINMLAFHRMRHWKIVPPTSPNLLGRCLTLIHSDVYLLFFFFFFFTFLALFIKANKWLNNFLHVSSNSNWSYIKSILLHSIFLLYYL